MPFTRPLTLAHRTLGADREPLACTPLIGHDEDTLRRELDAVLAKRPDLVEWRVDFFAPIADTARVLAFAGEMRARAGDVAIVFTRRSTREGGQPIALDEDMVFTLYEAVCRSGHVDLVDVELSSDAHHWRSAIEAAHAAGVRVIGSFHDFQRTPSKSELVSKFAAMQERGADVAKVAVMPNHLRDVLTLLDATLEARESLSAPLISMSMGPYGALTRLFGWMYGSSVTFVVGDQASAPGQLPIADLRRAVEIVQRALGRG